MNVSKELLERAKTTKSAEELLAMAKAENLELTEAQAAKAFAELNKTGEISDEELDNVSGGGCGDNSPKGEVDSPSKLVYLYSVGQIVEVYNGDISTTTSTYRILSLGFYKYPYGETYVPTYYVQSLANPDDKREVQQKQIEIPGT